MLNEIFATKLKIESTINEILEATGTLIGVNT